MIAKLVRSSLSTVPTNTAGLNPGRLFIRQALGSRPSLSIASLVSSIRFIDVNEEFPLSSCFIYGAGGFLDVPFIPHSKSDALRIAFTKKDSFLSMKQFLSVPGGLFTEILSESYESCLCRTRRVNSKAFN